MIFYQFIKYLRDVYTSGYKKLKYTRLLNLTNNYFDTIFMNFQNSIKCLHERYIKYMKNVFSYYDTVRFITLDMIYDVFCKLKRVFGYKHFDYIILMGLQSYVSKITLSSSFIYRDDTAIKDLSLLVNNCSELWDNEKQELTLLDFDSYNPFETAFYKDEYKKIIQITVLFSTYICTGYYIKNTLKFFNCLEKLHERSKMSNKCILNCDNIDVFSSVICDSFKRMTISQNKLKQSIDNLGYTISIKRLKWGFYSFIHYDNCKILTNPCYSDKKTYYEKKFNVKMYPKSVIDVHNNNRLKRRKQTIHLPTQNVLPVIINTTSIISNLSPVCSNIKSGLQISYELTNCIHMFNRLQKDTSKVSVDDVQKIISIANDENNINNKIIGSFFSFIDIFTPFAVARKTYDIVSNLTSVNTEHSNVTLFVLNKWRDINVLDNHNIEKINIQYLLQGTPADIQYKITKMNLTYFEESFLNNSYYDYMNSI